MTPAAADPRALQAGALLSGKLRLLRKIGQGAMGAVHEAEVVADGALRGLSVGDHVAVKLLSASARDTTEADRGRFAREARLASNLRSANIVTTYDGGTDEERGISWLAMQLLVGEDLDRLVRRLGALHPQAAVRIALQAATGLAEAHAHGIIHRDIKPSNLFLHDEAGKLTVKICDFGLAKRPEEQQEAQLTATGSILGSPLYMSPEQLFDARRVDHRADVWSLSMTLFEMLAGKAALAHCTSLSELVFFLSTRDVPSLQAAAPWVDPGIATVVQAALLRDLDQRCPSIDALIDALRAYAGGSTQLTPALVRPVPPEMRELVARRAPAPASWSSAVASVSATTTSNVGQTAPQGAGGDALVGSLLGGRYRLASLLGRGGMGAVYEAEDVQSGAQVAIKVLLGGEAGSDNMRRFIREARASMAIKSEHVVQVIDADTDPEKGTPFIVLELLRGTDLDKLVKQAGALEPAAVCRLFVQACKGLAVAHAHGIVHRDIKPANIFLHEVEGGRIIAKICDFGVAKNTAVDTAQTSDLTHTGGMVGSPMYMSPEQAKSAKHVDARTDIWSLAISMHQALSGLKPWQSTASLGELILAICTQDPTPLQDVAPWVDPALADAVHRGLQRDPGERYASIDLMAAALEPFAAPAQALDRQALTSLTHERKAKVAPRATGVGSSTQAHRATSAAADRPAAPPAASRGFPLWAVGAVGIALASAIALVSMRSQQPRVDPAPATTVVVREIVSVVSVTAPPPPAPTASVRHVARLAVKPLGAHVTVQGHARDLSAQGELLLEGEAGETFEVVAEVGKARAEARVVIGRDGSASPSTLVVPLAPLPGARPASGPVGPAAPATTAAKPPPPPPPQGGPRTEF